MSTENEEATQVVREYNEEQAKNEDLLTDEFLAEQRELQAAISQGEIIRPSTETPSYGATGDPKREAGQSKPSLAHIPPVALYLEGEVMRQGAEKYGAYNWADHNMKASIYHDAILRHLFAWWLGEDVDSESQISHLAHIRACCGILIDQHAASRLVDDRPKILAPLQPIWEGIQNLIAKFPVAPVMDPEVGGFILEADNETKPVS